MLAWQKRAEKAQAARSSGAVILLAGSRQGSRRGVRGFTLVELVITMAVIMTLAGIAVPSYMRARELALVNHAVADIRILEMRIQSYQMSNGPLPNTLAELEPGSPLTDPWGNPYRYLNFANAAKGAYRKDRFLVPINSRYDLYSMGPDGASQPPLTAKSSQDDIVRANDGAFVGPAAQY